MFSLEIFLISHFCTQFFSVFGILRFRTIFLVYVCRSNKIFIGFSFFSLIGKKLYHFTTKLRFRVIFSDRLLSCHLAKMFIFTRISPSRIFHRNFFLFPFSKNDWITSLWALTCNESGVSSDNCWPFKSLCALCCTRLYTFLVYFLRNCGVGWLG